MFAYAKTWGKEVEENEHYSWEEVYAANRVSTACEEMVCEWKKEEELIDSIVEEYIKNASAHAYSNSGSFSRALSKPEAEVFE